MAKTLEVLRESESEFFLRVISKHKGVEFDKLSDFEKFALALGSMELYRGSELFEKILSSLKRDTGKDMSASFVSTRENQKDIWRFLNGDEYSGIANSCVEKYNSLSFDLIVKNCDEKYNKIQKIYFEEIPGFISLNGFLSIDEMIASVAEKAEKLGVLARLCQCGAISSNSYLANACFEKIKSGEKCNYSELNALGLWVLSGAVLCRKKELSIFLEGEPEAVISACEHLLKPSKRGRSAEPKIYFVLKAQKDFENFHAFRYRMADKNISPSILLDGERSHENIKADAKRFAKIYPIGCVSFQKVID